MKIPEILLVETVQRPGSLASVLSVIADEQLVIEHLQAQRRGQGRTLWEITVEIDESANPQFYSTIDALPNARFVDKSNRVLNRHRGGKIRMQPTLPVVTNGTTVLGLGDIGPLAGLPVMEGKASLFALLVGITAVPILVDTRDPARVVDTITAIAPSFGAIQLEDIAAPECFEIEAELVRRLDRPVLHDDQYGTAVVALAALLTAMRRVGGKLEDRTVGQVGMGAAGIGIARLQKAYGVRRLLGTDLREDSLARLAAIGGGRAGLGRSCATRTWSSQRPVCKGSSGRSGCARASSSLRSRTRMRRSSRSRRSITGPRLRPMARA
jgi:malate dehydrogenase (oxaloacetate-decarboxylating)